MREKLISLSIVKKGDWAAVHQFLQQDHQLASIDEKLAVNLVNNLDCEVVTIFDDDYPLAWREMPKPPFVVYLQGDRTLLEKSVVAVVGGKVANEYTKRELTKFLTELPLTVNVISGFELGVEAYANQKTRNRIVVLGSGVNKASLYEKRSGYLELSTGDLLLTELPPQANFSVSAYYRAYHLLFELAQVVCVFELASFDLRRQYLGYLTEVGKPVFVLPDRISVDTAGGLALINRGARCLVDSKIVLAEMEK